MSVAEIKDEINTLSQDERDEISAHLRIVELQKDTEFWKEMDRRCNDRNPENWISLNELDPR